ncbi:MAG TPA: twin-arginine translocase subunit TatC [Solirubrobacteraceae bacterium]|jgi:sec-independent protein translocase protein TatC|nr:twin-arginine translocase subunit TatC [Solirubrobacteraceae bacterium]
MATAIRPIRHEDRLSLIDHLDELRTRLIVSGVVLAIAFGVCLWQNHELLHIINKPLQAQTKKQVAKGQGTVGQAVLAQQSVLKVAKDTQAALALLALPHSGLSGETRSQLAPLLVTLGRDVRQIPRNPPGDNPVTLGVGEPFTTTLTVALYCALLIAAPLILYELYGFVLPALNPHERRIVMPLVAAIPFLFAGGVAFGYFVVLPAATRFFVNFNSSEFNVLVQASQYYKFAATVLLAMGLVFQVPVAILGLVRAGVVTTRQLRHNRRYAILACAAVAALLPGDAITLLLETIPLYLLYELSILVSSVFGRPRTTAAGAAPQTGSQTPAGQDAGNSSVQQIIDHTDPDLYG